MEKNYRTYKKGINKKGTIKKMRQGNKKYLSLFYLFTFQNYEIFYEHP